MRQLVEIKRFLLFVQTLNMKGFPVLAEANKWHRDTISGLLKKEKRNRVDELRNAG